MPHNNLIKNAIINNKQKSKKPLCLNLNFLKV